MVVATGVGPTACRGRPRAVNESGLGTAGRSSLAVPRVTVTTVGSWLTVRSRMVSSRCLVRVRRFRPSLIGGGGAIRGCQPSLSSRRAHADDLGVVATVCFLWWSRALPRSLAVQPLVARCARELSNTSGRLFLVTQLRATTYCGLVVPGHDQEAAGGMLPVLVIEPASLGIAAGRSLGTKAKVGADAGPGEPVPSRRLDRQREARSGRDPRSAQVTWVNSLSAWR